MPSSWKKSFLRHLLLLALKFTFVTMRSAIQLPTNSIKINDTSVYGRNATLRCPVFEIGGHRVAWMRYDTRTILSLHGELVTQSNRYAIINKEEGSYDLFITNVIDSDAGTYICQINSEPMKNLVIFLKVVKPPTIDEGLTSNSLTTREGQIAILNCSASGDPPPKIYWRRQNKHELIRGLKQVERSILILKNVQKRDAGSYLCIAKNDYPPAVSHTVKLIVHYKPRITLAHSTNFKTGETEVLCAIDAVPDVTKHGLMVGGEYVRASKRRRFEKMELRVKVKVMETTRVVCHGQNYLDEVSTAIFISGIHLVSVDSITETTLEYEASNEDESEEYSTSPPTEGNDYREFYSSNTQDSNIQLPSPSNTDKSRTRKRQRDRRKDPRLYSSPASSFGGIQSVFPILLLQHLFIF